MARYTDEDTKAWVIRTRRAQGLPDHIEDPATLARIAQLLGLWDESQLTRSVENATAPPIPTESLATAEETTEFLRRIGRLREHYDNPDNPTVASNEETAVDLLRDFVAAMNSEGCVDLSPLHERAEAILAERSRNE